jgi:filamentous hemagglutinin
MKRLVQGVALFVVILASAVLPGARVSAQGKTDPTFGRPHIDAVTGAAKILDDAKVVDFGKVIYKGKIDVNPTLDRIRAGKSLKHQNDGAIFGNRERRLPRNTDEEYYREFVHQMKGTPFPGPQRVIIGKKGEVYYTGDHYHSFTRVR